MSKYIISNGRMYEVSDELTHYGVKGMKWGVRRYQNKDGSLTPAGKKRLVKDIRSHFNRDRDYGTESRLVDRNAVIKNAHLSEKLTNSRKKLDELSEIMRDYDESDDVQFKYKVKSLIELGLETEESAKKYTKNDLWLMYDDWDQGDYKSSVDLYLRDKGTTLREYQDTVDKAVDEYRSVCKEYTDSALEEYGKMTVNRRYSWEGPTANDAMVDALVDKADDHRLRYRHW